MTPYDAKWFTPPAPLARVVLRRPDTGTTLPDVCLLIDYGADVTLIPRAAMQHLGASILPGPGFELVGFDGTKSVASAVHLDLLFLKRAFKGRFLLIDQVCGVMGRDILNHLVLLLDGPKQVWSEYKNA